MIGLIILLLTGSAHAGPVKEFRWLSTTLWTYDDPLTCKDDFSLDITDDVEGQDYVLEVGILTRDAGSVQSLKISNFDGTPAQIGGTDLVLKPSECTADRCSPEQDHPAPEGYHWTLYTSGSLPSAKGDQLHALSLTTVMDPGGEEAVGSMTASYISTNSWQYGDIVIPAYTEGVLEQSDWATTPEGNIHVSGGTTHTVVHGCSHSPGLAGMGWFPLLVLTLVRRNHGFL